VNFSWFSSAYDTDDWFFRIATMVQMVGVLVLTLGLPAMFASLDDGSVLNCEVMVAGYVVMRIAMVALWVRAAQQDPARRTTALTYAVFILLAQVGWVAAIVLRAAPPAILVPIVVFALIIDVIGPIVAEREHATTPWNARHIAARYGLLVIVALGSGVFGTIASVSALVEHGGWNAEAVLIVVAGTGLTFGLWWLYFTIPSSEVLHRRRERGALWGYLHIPLFASITATGAGLHVAASAIAGEGRIGETTAVVAVAAPVLIYVVLLFVLYSYLLHAVDGLHVVLLSGTVSLLALAAVLAESGVPVGTCLIVVMAAPLVIVVGYEGLGYRHEAIALEETLAP
jgi:low temperature requirement protein LtrA